jgi:starch phosphorylase
MAKSWSAIRIGALRVEAAKEQRQFTAEVFLGATPPDAVRVELYANGMDGAAPTRHEMIRGQQIAGGYVYRTLHSTSRPITDYTVRVMPDFAGLSIPLEAGEILWQR